MHQPVLHLDTEEPSLVPQWLKDGVLKRNGCGTRGNRAGVQEQPRRAPSLGAGWESQRPAAELNTGSADINVDEHSKHSSSRLSRSNSLRGVSSSKLGAGSSWSSKTRSQDRYSSFERVSATQERNSSNSNGTAHDYWSGSSEPPANLTHDNRGERQLSKDYTSRSALLYSSKPAEDVSKDVEAPHKKEFSSLRVTPAASSQSLSLETEFPALSPATAASTKVGNWTSSLADASALSPVTSTSNKGGNWTSSLAEAPAGTTGSSVRQPAAKNGTFAVQNGVRMAEAIQNAAANSTVANNEKSAREQLAVKQSKQLVPVIATNKHKGAVRLASDPKLNSGVDGRKDSVPASRTLERLGSVERPDGKKTNGMLALKPQNSLKLSTRPSNRTTFFESLRRTNSVGAEQFEPLPIAGDKKVSRLVSQSQHDDLQQLAPVGIDREEVSSRKEAAAAGEGDLRPRTEAVEVVNTVREEGVGAAQPVCNGHAVEEEDDAAKLTAEEEAFLRSLGWTDTSDDEDYALTEEEIAAFKATVGNKTLLPVRPRMTLLPLSPHSSLDQYMSDSESDSSSDFEMY